MFAAFCRHGDIRKYIVVAAFSLFLSAVFLRTPGTYDVTENWLPWMLILHKDGLFAGYARIADMYPPGAAALLMAADAVLPALPDLTVIDLLLGLFLVTNPSKWLLRVLFAAVYVPILVAAIRTRRHDPARMMTFAMAGFVAYFLLAPSVHENHLFVPVVLGFVLWTRVPGLAPAVVATAALFNMNLLLFYGLTGTSPLPRDHFFALLTGTLSATALLAFAFVLWLLCRETMLSLRGARSARSSADGQPPLLESEFGRMIP